MVAEARTGLGPILGASAAIALQQGLTALAALASSALAARALGPDGLGQMNLAWTQAWLLTNLCALGLGSALVYQVSGGRLAAADAAALSLAATALLGGLGAGLGYLWPGSDAAEPTLRLATAACVPALILQQLLTNLVQGLRAFRLYNGALALGALATLATVALQVALGAPTPAAFLFSYAAAQGLCSAILLRGLARRKLLAWPPRGRLRASWRDARSYALRAWAGLLIAYLIYRTDVFILARCRGAAEVGIYSIASGVGERLWLLSFAASAALLPRVAQQVDANSAPTAQVTRLVLASLTGLAALLGAVAPWLIPFLFGEAYRSAIVCLWLLLPGLVLMGAGRVLSQAIAGAGRPGLNACVGLLTLSLAVTTSLLWAPGWGAAGVALATSLAYIADALVKAAVYCRLTGAAPASLWRLTRADGDALGAWLTRRGCRRDPREQKTLPQKLAEM